MRPPFSVFLDLSRFMFHLPLSFPGKDLIFGRKDQARKPTSLRLPSSCIFGGEGCACFMVATFPLFFLSFDDGRRNEGKISHWRSDLLKNSLKYKQEQMGRFFFIFEFHCACCV